MTEPGIYQHYKGNRYEFIAVGKMAGETEEPVAIYRALHTGLVWVRPLSEVEGEVEWEGKMVQRFTKVE